ncbi:unnamed protein product [Didymodactylos carnosus]|uniref:Uncharacterized protein n=1 Tax=Didymodactylos carnosus TaxID=1234261 RepID=A0A8S2L605_9BILA|nr:unnamed protein product [Didymodactylos carnosus]CAF3888234.1 unnamed protein product [Didymodactylos carnosus]
MLRFCRRTARKNNNISLSLDAKVDNAEAFTFDRLRKTGISARQLFDWYAPLDTIEEYILGQNEGQFFNCSKTEGNFWFGPRCEYMFNSNDTLVNIIVNQFTRKNNHEVLLFTNGTCYPMNGGECQSVLCLDWREICDGKIDCKNGLDEYRCHELEMNECDSRTEYRCLNGQCIDQGLYSDREFDCLDFSDETSHNRGKVCYNVFTLDCDDRLCPPTWFSRGDGSCRIKCLSFHCLSDGNEDCPKGEDERQNNTCSLALPHRYQCDKGTRCIPYVLVGDNIVHCSDRSDEYGYHSLICFNPNDNDCRHFRKLPVRYSLTFHTLCNGVPENILDSNNNTDESDCLMNEWRCLTEHSRCNKVWNCPDGRDEVDCNQGPPTFELCVNHTHFCLNMTTGLPICLPQSRAGDGNIDCVGSLDERAFCRTEYPGDIMRRYRCRNSNQCISPMQICDCHQDCPENDDEMIACVWLNNGQEPFCHHVDFRCRNGIRLDCTSKPCRCDRISSDCADNEDELFCELVDTTWSRPLLLDQVEQYPNEKYLEIERGSSASDGFIAWHCNRGLYVRSTDNPSNFYCFCPDYYYGDRCQYQRKRISLILQPIIAESFDRLSIFKIVALLVRQNSIILSHDQFFYVPQVQCLPKYFLNLLYPINESWSSSFNHSVHVHSFNARTLQHLASWQFDVSFDFLPVIRIVKRLLIADTGMKDELAFPTVDNRSYNLCSISAIYLGYDIDLGRDICVCPLNCIGRRCLISFDQCNNDSCYGHGQCIPIDERFDVGKQFICLCDVEWSGDFCEETKAMIHVSFASGIIISSFKTALIHIILQDALSTHLTYFHSLHSELSTFTVFLEKHEHIMGLIFIQLHEDLNRFVYYLLAVEKGMFGNLKRNISTEVHPSRRCRSIDELFNATVISQPRLRRIKHYQQPCLKRISGEKLKCFYDDELICVCDKTNYAFCINFESASFECLWNKCSNRGKCVQNHEICPSSSLCLCEPCSYGSICQFSTAGYSLSLDAILGSHLGTKNTNIFEQTRVIKLSMLFLSILFITGAILNVFAIGTFAQKMTHKVGCGLYLFISSFLGLLTMIMLMCKMILLIYFEQQSITCSLVEFLLKWGQTGSGWLNACVAVERTLAVIRQAQYSNLASKRRAKWVVMSVLLLMGVVCSPELIFRRTVIDRQDQRVWCVFNLNNDQRIFQTLYSVLNILLFIVPLSINLLSSILIIMGTFRSKTKTTVITNVKCDDVGNEATKTIKTNVTLAKLNNRSAMIKEQIIKHKHILIAPVLLGIFSVPHSVLAFILVCTKIDRNPFVTLSVYLIGYFPSMAIPFAFVLPSQTYRKACHLCVEQILPQCIRKWLETHRRPRL